MSVFIEVLGGFQGCFRWVSGQLLIVAEFPGFSEGVSGRFSGSLQCENVSLEFQWKTKVDILCLKQSIYTYWVGLASKIFY